MVPRTLRSRIAAAAAVLFAIAAASASPATAADRESESLTERFAAFERSFAADPGRADRPGSGWKPYNRLKWFYEQRMVDGQDPPIGARWRAWEAMQEVRLSAAESPRAAWFSLGPTNLAGRILALEFDPSNSDVLYAGSASGGLWKSTNGGVSWTALTDELPTLAVGGVAVWPNDPNVVVMGTGEGTINIDRVGGVGILRSTDGGATWNTTGVGYAESSGHGFHFIEANPLNGTMLAGATDGLWRSTDGGINWTQVRVGGDYYDGAWKPGDANVCFTAKGDDGAGNNVKISTDDGVTWTKVGTGQPASFDIGKTKIAMTPADPDRVYAIMSMPWTTGALLGVFVSVDAGSTWTAGATTPNMVGTQGWYNLTLAVDPNDADQVIAGGVNLYRSTDAGATFGQIASGVVHVDHHAIAYRPGSSSNVFVGTDGGVWESTNDGTSWIDRNSGLVTYQFYDICVNNHSADPSFIMGGTQDQGTDRWGGTTTWSEGLGGDGMVCNINPLNGTAVYAETQFGVHYKNTNAGVGGWSSINSGIIGAGDWVTPVDQDQNAGSHLYTSTNVGVFRTTNGGSSWTDVGGQYSRWISISPIDGDVVWTVRTAVQVSTNDGASWTAASGFPFLTGTPTKILAHPTDVDAAFVTFSGYLAGRAHIALTTDRGASWQDVTGDFPSQPVNAIAVDALHPDLWFIGTDVGVWYSTDGGAHWATYEVGLPNSVVADLEIQSATQKLFCGTHGRGAWEVEFSDLLSLDEVEDEESVVVAPAPIHLKLDRPYPNPTGETTTLRFAARHDGEIVVEIYDVRGSLVSEVARVPYGDGIIRNARWHADDVPNGVYFAVLRAGKDRLTRKVVVAKP